MKLSIRLSNAGLISIVGLIVALLLLTDISAHRHAVQTLAPNSDRIVTRELVLVDSAGRTRARMAVDSDDAPSLQLYDKQGTKRALLRLNQNDVPSLRMYNADGKVDSVLGYNLGTMDPALVFFDGSGTGRLASTPFEQAFTNNIFHDADLYPYESRQMQRGFQWRHFEQTSPRIERDMAPQVLELGDHSFDE